MRQFQSSSRWRYRGSRLLLDLEILPGLLQLLLHPVVVASLDVAVLALRTSPAGLRSTRHPSCPQLHVDGDVLCTGEIRRSAVLLRSVRSLARRAILGSWRSSLARRAIHRSRRASLVQFRCNLTRRLLCSRPNRSRSARQPRPPSLRLLLHVLLEVGVVQLLSDRVHAALDGLADACLLERFHHALSEFRERFDEARDEVAALPSLVARLAGCRLVAVASWRDGRRAHRLTLQSSCSELLLKSLLRLGAETQLATDRIFLLLRNVSRWHRG